MKRKAITFLFALASCLALLRSAQVPELAQDSGLVSKVLPGRDIYLLIQ